MCGRFSRAATVSLVLALIRLSQCTAQSAPVDLLAARGALGIPVAQARDIQSKLGQLMVVNVDGFGQAGALGLEPGFPELVSELQVGGVIPHYGTADYLSMRRTNRGLAALTGLPLLLCCDIVKIRADSRTASFGDGYVGGFLGKYRDLSDSSFDTLARLNAFAFAAIGVNVALGPTVDTSTGYPRTAERAHTVTARLREFAIAPVLKHFPFLPVGANLHRESPDTALPLGQAEKRFAIFEEVGGEADIMMTTHLYDSLVDRSLVTFSSRWNALLRGETGFTGLLMSDGLLMLRHYADRSVLAGGPAGPDAAGLDETAVWALRAILAGHDFVIVEGSPAQARRVYNGLLLAACRATPLGERLRARIEESYGRISGWKKAHAFALRRQVDVPVSTISAVIRILPGPSAALTSFRFDRGALERLEPALRAAEVGR
jgi:beta-glucosidase-like glycosyl hydrolase